MLIFGLHSTSDDWLNNLSNESRLKCGKRPPKSLHNKILIFGLHSTSDDWPSDLSDESWSECKKNEMLFQLGSSFVLVRVFCCFSLGLLLFQSRSSVCPPSPDGKVGNRVAEKFRFFIFTFNKFQPKDNSVQYFHRLLAMQLICDGQCTNWFTLHFYNL